MTSPVFDDEAGWVALPALLSDAEVDEVLGVCHGLLALPPDQRRARDKPAAGTRHLDELDDRSSLIAGIVGRRALVSAVTEVLGPDHRATQVSYRSPQPGYGGQKLHADGMPRRADESPSVATAIVALVDFTTDNGATRLVPGSHRRPDIQRLSGQLDHHPDEIVLTCSAGTAFLFDGNIVHSGTPNRSEGERPALQLLWHRN